MSNRTSFIGRAGKGSTPTLLLLVLLAGLANPATAQDMLEYREQTQRLVQQGQFAEALERVLWFHHNALTQQPSMAGVRLSYALTDWQRLGQVYPPAMAALVETREGTLRKLLENPADRQLFIDLQGFNRFFQEAPRTLEVFEQIAGEHPQAATSHWDVVRRLAIESQRLDLLRTYGADLMQEFERDEMIHAASIRLVEERMPALAARTRPRDDDRLVSQSLILIETALALGEQETAKAIQTRALEIVPHERLRSAVP